MTTRVSEKGFSLIELIVVMFLLGFAIMIASNSFVTVLKKSKLESKIAETQIEKIVGLEILRQDIEEAGIGLPWYVEDINGDNNFNNDWSALNNYLEADNTESYNAYDDAPDDAPRAIVGDNAAGLNNSDILVIKSTVVRINDEARKWTYLTNDGTSTTVNTWSDANENFDNETQVIAILPKISEVHRVLMTRTDVANNVFFTQYENVTTSYTLPTRMVYMIYGIGPDNDPAAPTSSLRMPFNRADYFITNANVPARCAPGTGVLIKAQINHSNGRRGAGMALIDCVADFQVIFGLDMDEDGTIGTYSTPDGLTVTDAPFEAEGETFANVQSTLSDAALLRNRLKEVRIYILTHEGQRDTDFEFGQTTITVGEYALGQTINLPNVVGDPEYSFYRWKVYTLVVRPENLRGGS